MTTAATILARLPAFVVLVESSAAAADARCAAHIIFAVAVVATLGWTPGSAPVSAGKVLRDASGPAVALDHGWLVEDGEDDVEG